MSERSTNRKDNPHLAYTRFEFPKEGDGVLYVRQSSIAQVQTNIHSYEMQTEKFIEHFRNMGCTGSIVIIEDDEGMSGTLDMHERPGMSRIMEMIQQETIRWVGVVHVNRLFRDKWMINPDLFMKECFIHDVVVATTRTFFNFRDSYSVRIFRLESEDSARQLEWMKLILGGGKSAASDKGYYDGRYIAPGYIVDRSDPQRKKYIIYEPHAVVVRWLFRRFLELDGNFPRLCHELEQLPYVFPQFEVWVDSKSISRFSLHRNNGNNRTPEGDYMLFRHGLESILTNPVYIGWWIPLGGGVIEDNHEPIVEEGLFLYAHKRVSTYDFDGNRQKPARVIRNGHVEALLKKVLREPDGTPIYSSRANGGLYMATHHQGLLFIDHKFVIYIKTIDRVFLEKLFERLQHWQGCEEWEDKIVQKQEERQRRENLIKKQIKDAEAKIAAILDTLSTPDCPKPMKTDLFKRYEGLEKKKAELERDLLEDPNAAENDEETLYEIGTLLPTILNEWDNLPYETRLRFVSALVERVELSQVAPAWLKMEIHWKRLDWEVDVAHIRRRCSGVRWTDEETAVLEAMYPTEDAGAILQVIPNRSWRAIKTKALGMDIYRTRRGANSILVNTSELVDISFEDMQYAEENGLVLTTKNAQWLK